MTPAVGAVLMASGAGRRFGSNKLLAQVEGTPLISRVLSAVPAALFSKAVVCSPYPEILELAAAEGYLPLYNKDGAEGISASIRLGLSHMGGMDGVLFCVCDQPFLTTESIINLLNSFRLSKNTIHALSWRGTRGNPVLFPRSLFPALSALTGDTGGGAVIRAHPQLLTPVEVTSPRELQDVDTPADL